MDRLDDGLMSTVSLTAPSASTRAPRGRVPRSSQALLAVPAVVILAVFFVYPLVLIVWRSFSDPTIGLHNYVELFTNSTSLTVLLRTFVTALAVSTITLVMAYPYAYVMTRVSRRTRAVLLAIALLPFWMSLMARTFAWVVLLGYEGPVYRFFQLIGFDDVVLLGSVWGVIIGTVQVLLPYMLLTLYGTMQGIDARLVDAAQSLGATPRSAFRRVYLPLSLPGVAAGYTLVFVIALGFYITPRILGSPQQSLIAQVIGIRVERLLDFGGAGAMSVLLLVLTGLLLFVVTRPASNRRALEGGLGG